MSVHLALAEYDGKRVETLHDIKSAHEPSRALLSDLIGLATADEGDVQAGASWLFRAYLMEGASLDVDQVAELAAALPDIAEKWARLHLCQTIRHLDIPEAHAPRFADFLRGCTTDSNTLVRAWATDGFWHLARQHGTYGDEAKRVLEASLGDPAASIRARARRILAEDD